MFLFRAIRTLVWLPFAVAANIPLLIALNVATYVWADRWFFLILFWSVVICGLCMPIESRLRPPRRNTSKLPPRDRPILPSLAMIVVKARRHTPKAARIAASLKPELRALLATPVDRQPEAIVHDRRIAKLAS